MGRKNKIDLANINLSYEEFKKLAKKKILVLMKK